ncbi:hypothetical protein OF83DRAFT_415432 [Amylostereum chailletii]|nr:hypothetical protein OF83DRAFT_415432 [Amylostereum chailletii]
MRGRFKECQRAAWPVHKLKCKLNRDIKEGANPRDLDVIKALRQFTHKHRYNLASAAVDAFNLRSDITRASREIFVVSLIQRPGATRAESAFIAIDAHPESVSFFNDPNLEEQIRIGQEDKHYLGTVFVMLRCIGPDKAVCNVFGVGFGDDIYEDTEPGPWKKRMLTLLI